METRPAGEEVGWFGGSKELPVNARGGSDRPGYRRPERGGRTEPPIHSAAGLELEPGVVVVFDLCAQRQVEAVGAQGDLVLDEPGEPLARDVQRQECQRGVRADSRAIVDVPVPEPPDHVMPVAQSRTVLQIDVVGVEILAKQARDVAGSPGALPVPSAPP